MASRQESPSSSSSSSFHLKESSLCNLAKITSRNITVDDARFKDEEKSGSDVDSLDDESQSCLSSRLVKNDRSPSPNDQPIVDDDGTGASIDQDELERHKKAVYDHPLFPVLGKCHY